MCFNSYAKYSAMSERDEESVASGQSSATNDGGILSLFPELRISGLIIPKTFDSKWIESMKDKIKLKSHDIWIVTYPKCGTSWTQ